MERQGRVVNLGRCTECGKVGKATDECTTCRAEGATHSKRITTLEVTDLDHLGIGVEEPQITVNCIGCYRQCSVGFKCRSCKRDALGLSIGENTTIHSKFVARFYKESKFQGLECSDTEEDEKFDVNHLGDTDDLDATAVTRGQDGAAKKDWGSGSKARDNYYTRPHYYKQPKPEFGTTEYILEAVVECGVDDDVCFNETMYARLKDMAVQAFRS